MSGVPPLAVEGDWNERQADRSGANHGPVRGVGPNGQPRSMRLDSGSMDPPPSVSWLNKE